MRPLGLPQLASLCLRKKCFRTDCKREALRIGVEVVIGIGQEDESALRQKIKAAARRPCHQSRRSPSEVPLAGRASAIEGSVFIQREAVARRLRRHLPRHLREQLAACFHLAEDPPARESLHHHQERSPALHLLAA